MQLHLDNLELSIRRALDDDAVPGAGGCRCLPHLPA